MVIISTPKKLKIAAVIIAALGVNERVDTQVAIAFGASVQPLTRITLNVRIDVIKSEGLFIRLPINSVKVTVI